MEMSYILTQAGILVIILAIMIVAIFTIMKRKTRCTLDYLETLNNITLRSALEICVLEKTPPLLRGVIRPLIRMLCIDDLVKLCKGVK